LFGIGTFPQVNAIADAAQLAFEVPKWTTGLILAVLVALITVGGIESISRVSTKVVPFMAALYVLTCFGVMYINADQLPAVIHQILNAAFTTTAATGGFAGATMMLALQAGVARGVFSNESGLGSAPIAAAAAKTDSCVEQGLVCMTGTFFDTIIICTMTGITLVLTGAWQSDVAGTAMTNMAFTQGIGSQLGFYLVNIGLLFFAFTTIIGWNYYGERCTEYLLGVKAMLVIAVPATSDCQAPVRTRVIPVMVQMMMVSKKVPVMQTRPCSTQESVFAAAAAIGAEPKPDSLENTPRATPACSASIIVAPAKPPVAAVVVNAAFRI
jgi:AGCS family alanine or glycine:cation symporter